MTKTICSLILISCLHIGCMQHEAEIKIHPNYDLANPVVFNMPPALNEISGIAFDRGKPDTLYAEQDEEGRLFYFSPGSQDVKHQKFGKKGDYEDIAICNGTVVLLRSDGVLFSFPLNTAVGEEIASTQEFDDLLPKGEYESLYADDATNQLYVLCKNCRSDNDAKSVSGYILQLNAAKSIEQKSSFQVSAKMVAASLDQKKIVFKPSALAKNAADGLWYILSSVDKLLVTADGNWNIKDTYPLSPKLFNQPEGIAFDKDNNLYISNEKGLSAQATVLKFKFQKSRK